MALVFPFPDSTCLKASRALLMHGKTHQQSRMELLGKSLAPIGSPFLSTLGINNLDRIWWIDNLG